MLHLSTLQLPQVIYLLSIFLGNLLYGRLVLLLHGLDLRFLYLVLELALLHVALVEFFHLKAVLVALILEGDGFSGQGFVLGLEEGAIGEQEFVLVHHFDC